MKPIDYHKDYFHLELAHVVGSNDFAENPHGAFASTRLSICELVPNSHPESKLESLNDPVRFLFCYFFSSLLDQAFHSSLKEEHHHFEKHFGYPKLCGIFGSYWSILHPNLILLAATLYLKDQRKAHDSDFQELAKYFPIRFKSLLTKEYPKMTGRLECHDQQRRSIRLLFMNMHQAITESPHAWWRNNFSVVPKFDMNAYENWISFFESKLKAHLH
jgi:hypothetical protein